MENTLYYVDNLHILRDYIPDNSIDLGVATLGRRISDYYIKNYVS